MYTTSLVEAAQVSEETLKCPNCSQPLTLYEIEDIVGPELYEKYQKFLLRGFKLSSDDSNTFIFNCPATDCEFFCIADNDLEEIECQKCFHLCCPKCKANVHKGISCEENKKSFNNENQFEKMMIMEGIIKCPSCGAAVQRIDGCEFMICTSSQCQGRTYFCYDCGIKLAADHAPHPCDRKLAHIRNNQRLVPGQRARGFRPRPRRIRPRGLINNVIGGYRGGRRKKNDY